MASSSSAAVPPAAEGSAPESPAFRPHAPKSSEKEPLFPLLICDEGVEVRDIHSSWMPGRMDMSIPFPPEDDRLLVELRDWQEGTLLLLGIDLQSGQQEASFYPDHQAGSVRDEVRRVTEAEDWEIKIFSADSYSRHAWTRELERYTLPEALREGRRQYVSGWDWDAQPERDLLTWTDPEGLWLAGADGSDPRLLLRTEEMGPYLVRWEMMRDYRPYLAEGLPEGDRLAFLTPRLMNGGRTVAVDFGQWGNQMGHNGLVTVDIATGRTDWYNHYVVMTAGDHEFLDDTRILMGVTLIDVVTGETEPAGQWTLTDRAPLYTGDFTHYFGSEKQADGCIDLFTCTLEDWQEAKPFLTASGYRHFCPVAHSVVDARRVLCWAGTEEEEGLKLVILPEK